MVKDTVLRWADTIELNRGAWPAALLLGLVDRLSGGDPELVNRYGAKGLFQIHPDTAAQLGVDPDNLVDPDTATIAAVALLDDRQGQIKNAIAQAAQWDATDDQVLALTLAAYWYGPAKIVQAIVAGHGPRPADVFRQLASGQHMADFVADVLARAAEYETHIAPAANGQPANGQPANGQPKASPGRTLLGLAIAAGVIGLGIWAVKQSKW